MNTQRYVVAGAVSLLVHSMFLAAMPTKDPITLTMGIDTPHVSLTFAAISPEVAQASQSTVTPLTPVTPTVPKPTKSPVVSTMKRLAKTTTADKAISKKASTSKKATIQKKTIAPKKTPPIKKTVTPVKKKQLTHKKPIKQTSEVVTPTTATDAKTALKPIKASPNQSNTTATTAVDNAGTQTLKLVSKPTFATRPGSVNYPKLAKRRGIEGQVLIEVWIGTKGQQLNQKLIKSSGAQILDNAAIAAIKKWHFSAHIVNGTAIAHRVQIPVRFKLD
ncbi:energy transducer TonB [Photobacterium phosphoreum]|uniref:energy transducer TonB n=1 Tax=Photobacterium phosphoreum TaxID=659 RepID=UPI000D176F57|nr:energy transducer TonB [Photobacterium phosphoreum]PSU67541.1 energy transducer TonB [Photobacterium phosphoreum]PSW08201.1 energy transducer TonB [Photobacterium phosphoreum]